MHAGWEVTAARWNTLISFGTSSLRHIRCDEKNHSAMCFTQNVPKRLGKYTMYEIKIPGHYKRNRHFQCCIEMKLLMI